MTSLHSASRSQSLRWFVPLLSATCLLTGAGLAQASGPAPHDATARYEIEFMESMIDHHARAVEMSKLCPERAVHPELTELCNSIKASQEAEIRQMQAGLRSWYGVSHEPQLFDHEQQDIARLAMLSGAEFEKAFLKMMTPHHMIAIQSAAVCEVRVFHGQLLSLCESIVKAQAHEITTMRGWLCKWHGTCDLNLHRSATVDEPGPGAGSSGVMDRIKSFNMSVQP